MLWRHASSPVPPSRQRETLSHQQPGLHEETHHARNVSEGQTKSAIFIIEAGRNVTGADVKQPRTEARRTTRLGIEMV